MITEIPEEIRNPIDINMRVSGCNKSELPPAIESAVESVNGCILKLNVK